MRNYFKLSIIMLISLCATACTKSDADFPNNGSTTVNLPKSNALATTQSAATASTVKKSAYQISAPIEYINKSNITITGDSINGGTLPCIYLINCKNVHISHCKLVNSLNFGVYLNNCSNVLIDSSYIADVRAGVYAEACPKGEIRVQYNQMQNMKGPFPHADFIQFDRVDGADNRIVGNKLENIEGQSNPEDAINLYMCNGSPSNQIYVVNNWIRGGGPSITGSGITVGDNGGSYEVVQNNTVVNPGYGGIDCAGGNHITIKNNNVYSSSFPWSGCGLGCSNFTATPASNNTITSNKVNWIAGHWGGYRRDTVYRYAVGASANPMPAGWKSNTVDASINTSMLPATIIDFK